MQCSQRGMRFHELAVKIEFEETADLNPAKQEHFFCAIYLARLHTVQLQRQLSWLQMASVGAQIRTPYPNRGNLSRKVQVPCCFNYGNLAKAKSQTSDRPYETNNCPFPLQNILMLPNSGSPVSYLRKIFNPQILHLKLGPKYSNPSNKAFVHRRDRGNEPRASF